MVLMISLPWFPGVSARVFLQLLYIDTAMGFHRRCWRCQACSIVDVQHLSCFDRLVPCLRSFWVAVQHISIRLALFVKTCRNTRKENADILDTTSPKRISLGTEYITKARGSKHECYDCASPNALPGILGLAARSMPLAGCYVLWRATRKTFVSYFVFVRMDRTPKVNLVGLLLSGR